MKKKIIIWVAIVMLLIAGIIGIIAYKSNNLLAAEPATISKSTTVTKSGSASTAVSTRSYGTLLDTSFFEITGVGWDGIPTYTDEETGITYTLHCYQHGIRLRWNNYNTMEYSHDEIVQMRDKIFEFTLPDQRLTYDIWNRNWPVENGGYWCTPYYEKSGSGSLSDCEAYIYSSGSSYADKQNAIWNLQEHSTSTLVTEGNKYSAYKSKVSNNGMNPNDATDVKSVQVTLNNTNTTTSEETIGPFKITYNAGNNMFSGITNIVAIGYNKNDQVVKNNIRIKAFYLQSAPNVYSNRIQPSYFSPDSYFVDKSGEIRKYPSSGQNFKIVIDNPNVGKSETDPNWITTYGIKVTFKYMLADGSYVSYSGHQERLTHTRLEQRYNPRGETTYIKWQLVSEIYNCQNQESVTAKRSQYMQEITIKLPQQETTTGNLTVQKFVIGENVDTNKAFNFTVTLSNKNITGTYDDMTFKNGVATFTLKHKQKKVATGLPAGITYTVVESEANKNGYTTTYSGTTGTIKAKTTSVAVITNKKNIKHYGTLSVKKVVTGEAGDKNKNFNFTVTLSDKTITGTYGEMKFTNGVATFTLKHGQSKTAEKLPEKITYTVVEKEANKDGYTTTYSGTTGTISEQKTSVATVTNYKDVDKGNLTVKKVVTGEAGEKNKEFNFTVTLSNKNINGTYGEMTFKNGVATFALKHGQSKTAEKLPVGITYTVKEKEANKDGYKTTYSGETGTISKQKTSVATVTNDNGGGDKGNLTVQKVVTGEAGDKNKNFNFTVTLSDNKINGKYGDMTFVNGVAKFPLKHGQSKTATELPVGITYKVVEAEANKDGYKTTYTGTTGTISKQKTSVAAFTNDKTTGNGNLTVQKVVIGDKIDTNKAFNFTVTLSDKNINGKYGEMTFENGVAKFSLKHGQSKTAERLPAGITYTVVEAEANTNGYKTTYTGETGTIKAKTTSVAVVTNKKDDIKHYGDLSVQKVVTGELGEKNKSFNFTVTLSDKSINGKYGDMTFKNGVATFTLKHKESKTAEKLPEGLEYTVIEKEAGQEGYETSYTGTTGTITKSSASVATFTNHKEIKTYMELGGYVWLDSEQGKTDQNDGIKGSGEKVFKNIKVSLYDASTNKLATLVPDKVQPSDDNIFHKVNPTLTDENGYYEFSGLNPLKRYYVVFEYNGQKYLPTDYLTYNGTKYSSIQDMVNRGLYWKDGDSTAQWKGTSKAGENGSDRNNLNNKFSEIGSSPKGYQVTSFVSSSTALKNALAKDGGKYYNTAYSENELMGFVMGEDGDYTQGTRLLDGFKAIDNDGNIVSSDTIQEGEISKAIRNYVKTNKKYPDNTAMEQIYAKIAGNNVETWRKLQYIYDTTIKSYTGKPATTVAKETYPVYTNKFTISNQKETVTNGIICTNCNGTGKVNCPGNITKSPSYYLDSYYCPRCQKTWNGPGNKQKAAARTWYCTLCHFTNVCKTCPKGHAWYSQGSDNEHTIQKPKIDCPTCKGTGYTGYATETYEPIYPGQYFINLGLYERPKADVSVNKDIYRVATRINGKTEVYNYGRSKDDVWDLQVRMRDYDNYYGDYYNRDLYQSDIDYNAARTNKSGKNLEVYVTYKISVSNNSIGRNGEGLLVEIPEIVDYYDKDFTYMPNLSWAVGTPTNASYYNTMSNLKLNISGAKAVNTYNTSKYGAITHSDLTQTYNAVYIRGLAGQKLKTGEKVYIFLTFKVNTDSNGKVILDNDVNSLKQNYVEINGYKAYYASGTKLPNGVTINNTTTPAGLVDQDSTPGNLAKQDLTGNRYEKNFEDDTDRAKGLRIQVTTEGEREINGVVWEDQRTKTISNAIIGDGIRQSGEIGIQGVSVELVEKMANGNEYVWQTVTTREGGSYALTDFIPGDYIVRFKYGDKVDTVQTSTNGGSNSVSYNGQDFKSTVYNKNLNTNATLSNKQVNGQEAYNIKDADNLTKSGINMSDAKDLWKRREEVNNYSTTNVTNHKAEVLASPYNNATNNSLIQELITNTNMVAETPLIVAEVEYNQTETNGNNQGRYVFESLDFGLTERPKAQLELSKKVTNVKVVLANGNTLFDSGKSVDNLAWLEGKAYNLNSKKSNNKYDEYYNESKTDKTYNRYSYRTKIDDLVNGLYDSYPKGSNGLIQATMDNELMHGATITISYGITITNVGETDYTGQDFYYKGEGASESNKVTTSADAVLDYVANNLQYRQADNEGWETIKADKLISDKLVNDSLKDELKTVNTIVKTEALKKNLKPGESSQSTLNLSQTMTVENTTDDRTYENIAEIVQTSNTVGRRMAYSIVGNQDPTKAPAEVDSATGEQVIVLPPFGAMQYVYYGIGVLVVGMLIAGIIFIKKKVIK